MGGKAMKQTVKTSRTAGYLEKMFRALNENYFDAKRATLHKKISWAPSQTQEIILWP